MKKDLLSLKEIARLLEISPGTVNYYTNLGLFLVADRNGNYRLYHKKDILARFEKIKELRRQGYSLKLIQNIISRP